MAGENEGGDGGQNNGGGNAGNAGGDGAGGGKPDELSQLKQQNAELAKQIADFKSAQDREKADKDAAQADDLKKKGEYEKLVAQREKELEEERARAKGLEAKLGEVDTDVQWARSERKRQEDEVRARYEKVPADKRKALGDKPSVDAMRSFLAGFEGAGAAGAAGKRTPLSAGPGAAETPAGNYREMDAEARKAYRQEMRTNGVKQVSVPWGRVG